MIIEVTQKHIDESFALRKSALHKIDGFDVCRQCAIALAVREIWPDASVSYTAIDFTRNGKHEILMLPEDAIQFILHFEVYDNPQPFSFELDLP